MPNIKVNGVDIAYDWHGSADGPVVLLVMGLGMPSAAWPPLFIELLAREGFRVLTFDNRDIGQSETLDSLGMPSLFFQAMRYAVRLPINAPYGLVDMARDAEALLSGLDVAQAHVVGVSMGGMIAQLLALDSPERTASLTSIMSTTGNRRLPGPSRELRRLLVKGPKDLSQASREAHYRRIWPLISSPGFPQSAELFEAFLERIFARGVPIAGARRQTLAVAAAADRTARLKQLKMPTLVIHGDADAMVPVECGYHTAESVRDAEMAVIEGMGHNLPEALMPRITDLVTGHVRVADVLAADKKRPQGQQ